MSDWRDPLSLRAWPEALEAHAVDGGHAPRLHGYDVESDLALHYRFTDLLLLALTGELPDERRSRAFEITLCFLVPSSVAEAPVHAAVLAAYFGAPPGGLLSIGASTIAGDAADLAERVARAEASPELPADLRASGPEERASVERLAGALAGLVEVPLLARDPGREVALLSVLRALGLVDPLRLATAVALARLASVAAESAPRLREDFQQKYPVNVPPFAYDPDG